MLDEFTTYVVDQDTDLVPQRPVFSKICYRTTWLRTRIRGATRAVVLALRLALRHSLPSFPLNVRSTDGSKDSRCRIAATEAVEA